MAKCEACKAKEMYCECCGKPVEDLQQEYRRLKQGRLRPEDFIDGPDNRVLCKCE